MAGMVFGGISGIVYVVRLVISGPERIGTAEIGKRERRGEP